MTPDEEKKKKSITIVGKNQAREGYVFMYSGPMPECKACKVKNICFCLSPGQTYKVTGVRDKTHACDVFSEGGQVVEVDISPSTIAIDGKKAIKGSVVTLKETKCKRIACPHYKACTMIGSKKGDKMKIVSVGEKVDCPEGRVAVDAFPAE